ncbi:hypothetical protein QBC34DRAFT_490050 [Podospora aff. communis PSN243]|uniref:Uncharacterized protein n=1 Tax=Podospora aff. communis PSN243 TaxID=3040156 RepID=A0AAV9H3D6_9PEZI|nr:hypothetical protein QBC34DRAFT_490050 [Podospora aff. communis PSN243]
MPPRVEFALDDRPLARGQPSIDPSGEEAAKNSGVASAKVARTPHDELISLMRSLRTAHPIERNSAIALPEKLPRFGDLSCYGVSDVHEARLWELEANRLVKSLEQPHAPMLCALAICGLDDIHQVVSANLPGCRPNDAAYGGVITRCFLKLESRLKASSSVQEIDRFIQMAKVSRVNVGAEVVLDEEAMAAYYVVVDYITMTALERHARLRLHVRTMPHVPTIPHMRVKGGNLSNPNQSEPYVSRYASEMAEVSNWLFRVQWQILRDLVTRETRGRVPDEIDLSAAVYCTGSRDISTMTYQNRLGHLSGSTSGVAIGMCRQSLSMLYSVAKIMRDNTSRGDARASGTSILTIKTQNTEIPDLEVEIRSMGDIISTIVPLSCMDPRINDSLRSVCDAIHMSSTVADLHAKAKGFAAFVNLYSKLPIHEKESGFIIFIAKSFRVAEWSWRDFIKGQVRCRSVRELATTTGLGHQSIIMHLLSSEDELPILTKVPYNGMFARSDSGGFSIDVKPTIGILVASGFLVVQVLTERGPALVCLDLRAHGSRILDNNPNGPAMPDLQDRQCMVHDQRNKVLMLACRDLGDEGERDKDVVFRTQYIQWEKVVGLYDDVERKVW